LRHALTQYAVRLLPVDDGKASLNIVATDGTFVLDFDSYWMGAE